MFILITLRILLLVCIVFKIHARMILPCRNSCQADVITYGNNSIACSMYHQFLQCIKEEQLDCAERIVTAGITNASL